MDRDGELFPVSLDPDPAIEAHKRSAGRPKDLARITELEALREERDSGTP
jgi:hypothetical protein